VTIAAHAVNALHRLETAATPVHYTKDARVEEVYNEMATEMAALYGYRVTTLEKAVTAGDVKAVQAAVSELEAGDSALLRGVSDVTPAAAAKARAVLAPNRPSAIETSARVCNAFIGSSVPAVEAAALLKDDVTAFAQLPAVSSRLVTIAHIYRLCLGDLSHARQLYATAVQQYNNGCSAVARYPQSAGDSLNEVSLRNKLLELDQATLTMKSLAATLGVYGIRSDIAVDFDTQRAAAKESSVDGLVAVSGELLKRFNEAATATKEKPCVIDAERLKRTATVLHAIGADAVICAALEQATTKKYPDCGSLLQLLYSPFRDAMAAISRNPLESAQDADGVVLVTRVLPSLQSKLRAVKIFASTREEDTTAVVNAAAGVVMALSQHQAAMLTRALQEELQAATQKSPAATPAQAAAAADAPEMHHLRSQSSLMMDEESDTLHEAACTPATRATHCIVACILLAAELVAAGHPQTLLDQVTAIAKRAFEQHTEKATEVVKRAAKQAHAHAVTGFLDARLLLLRLLRNKPSDAVYDAVPGALASMRQEHQRMQTQLQGDLESLERSVVTYVEKMEANMAGNEQLPLETIANWLNQLQQLYPTERGTEAADRCLAGESCAAAITKVRLALTANIKLRHEEIAKSMKQCRDAQPKRFADLFKRTLRDGRKMELSGALEAYQQATGRALAILSLSFHDEVIELQDLIAREQTDALARELQEVVKVLQGARHSESDTAFKLDEYLSDLSPKMRTMQKDLQQRRQQFIDRFEGPREGAAVVGAEDGLPGARAGSDERA
jgi:hypothetical protein